VTKRPAGAPSGREARVKPTAAPPCDPPEQVTGAQWGQKARGKQLKPARGARSVELREINVVTKPVKRGDLGVAVAYPSIYEAAVKSLSLQMLYFYLNSLEGVFAERFVLRRLTGSEPPARSLESGRPLRDFWLILFSIHYEPDYVNLVRLLAAGGVNPLAREREQVVVVGGPPVIANPEPLSEVADVLVVGEIESNVPKLVGEAVTHAGDKQTLLDGLRAEEGFYVPSRGDERVRYNYPSNLPLEFHPAAQVQPERGKWRRTTMIELSRGCTRGCRFCMEGHIFLPKRDRPLEDILALAERGSRANSSRHLTLISLSLLDHPRADEMLENLVESGYEFSVPSLRLEALTDQRLELLGRSGQRTLVLAPETASEQLAKAVGKPLLRERLLDVAAKARKIGFKALKLYFMVGLPGESEEHVKSVAELVRRVAEVSGFKGSRELKLSVSVFVPKPQTPMQWFGMDEPEKVTRKIRLLKRELGGLAEVRPYKPAWASIQCVLSRGGRELTRLLLEWAAAGGGLGGWRRAVKSSRLNVERYTAPLEPGGEYPWSKVELPAGDRLAREYALCLMQLGLHSTKYP